MKNFLRGWFERKEKSEIEIAFARPGDERAINEVMYQAWLKTYPNKEHGVTDDDVHDRWKDRFSEERLAKRRADFAKPKEGVRVFVAKLGSTIIGMCRAVKGVESNRIQAIYIDPGYQGRGAGRALCNAAMAFFDPSLDIHVDVVDYNEGAIAFYRKMGFVDTGKRKQDERFRLKSGAIFTEMEMVRKAGS